MTAAALQRGKAEAFETAEIALRGVRLCADASGALAWPEQRVLIVADLHLEKGSSFARRGVFLPPYDTRETLERLAAVIARHAPATVIALGDSFHDADGAGRLGAAEARMLSDLQRGRTWVWVSGNHDGAAGRLPGGELVDDVRIGDIVLRHAPDDVVEAAEIAGHLHPAARVALPGASVRRPCFVSDGKRIVMPAFGAFTGGLNVLSEPFAALFPDRFEVRLVGRRALHAAPRRALRPD